MTTRVLILTPQTPFPPDQGAPIRNFNFINYLGSSPAYELDLLSFDRREEGHNQEEAYQVLSRYCRRLKIVAPPPVRSRTQRIKEQVTRFEPDLARRLQGPEFKAKLGEFLRQKNLDVILCEGLELVPFILQAFPGPGGERPRLVLDEHNAEFLLQTRVYQSEKSLGLKRLPAAFYSRIQAKRLEKYETKALGFFDRVIAVSENEKKALNRIAPEAEITVIPNGIDIIQFSPSASSLEERNTLVFSGTMDFRPNVDAVTWFVRRVWPTIRQNLPGARFQIVGRRPTPAVEALKTIPGVEVTGRVPDARPYLERSALFVLPMRMGGGVRLKLLEALALEKALVTTTFGADGVDLEPGKQALFADSPEDFARTCLALLNDPARRKELGRAGRKFVEENFEWAKITPLLDGVLKK